MEGTADVSMKLVRKIYPSQKKASTPTVSREMDASSPPENYLREGWKLKAKLGKEGGAARLEKRSKAETSPNRVVGREENCLSQKIPTLKRGEVGAEDLEYRTEQQSWRRREMWEVLRYWLLRSVL